MSARPFGHTVSRSIGPSATSSIRPCLLTLAASRLLFNPSCLPVRCVILSSVVSAYGWMWLPDGKLEPGNPSDTGSAWLGNVEPSQTIGAGQCGFKFAWCRPWLQFNHWTRNSWSSLVLSLPCFRRRHYKAFVHSKVFSLHFHLSEDWESLKCLFLIHFLRPPRSARIHETVSMA